MSSKVTNISTSALKKLVILLAFNSLAAARSSSRPSAFVARPPLPNSEIKTRSRSICCMVSSGAPQPHRVGGALSIFGGRGLLLKDQEQQHSSITIAPASCEDELEQQEPTTTYDYYYNDGIQIATVTEKNNFFGNKIDDFIEDTFDKADTNGNGRISASETYDLVLQIYLKINRQAPINPPSREKAALIFDNADKDQNGDIDRAEFKRLMAILLSRASTRLVAHKFFTLVGAPFLAWELTGFLSDKVGLLNWVATKLIAEQQYLETVTNEGFWQTVFTVLFVSTLGDTILTKTSSIYDKLLIEEKE